MKGLNNILIIEDEESVAEVMKAYLEKEGYRVKHTTRGLQGLGSLSLGV